MQFERQTEMAIFRNVRPRVCAVLGAVALAGGCATSPSPLPERQHSALSEAEWRPFSKLKPDPVALERFWRRDDVRIGMVKWDSQHSRAVKDAPTGLLQNIRDEVGRLNAPEGRTGEDVWVTVNVYRWKKPFFSKAHEAAVEIVGRDRQGQVVWMGQSAIRAEAHLAQTAADGPDTVVAQQLATHLRSELGL